MYICIVGDTYIRVTEQLADGLNVHTLCEQAARESMT